MGGGCEAPHLRSISPSFPDGFCILLIFYAYAFTVLQGGLESWYPRYPSIVEEALFLRGSRIISAEQAEQIIIPGTCTHL